MNILLLLIYIQLMSVQSDTNICADCVEQGYPLQDSMADKAIDKIAKLPEVVSMSTYIDSISMHQRVISLILAAKPKGGNGYYWVQVGDNNSIRFQVIYNFYVYLPSLTVKYFDPIADKAISLAQWRRQISKKAD